MSIKEITINGCAYVVQCADGEEEHLDLLSSKLNERVLTISHSLQGKIGDSMLLLLSALELEDNCLILQKRLQDNESQHAESVNQISERVAHMIDQIKKNMINC